MGSFMDIRSIFHESHPLQCPCKKTASDFNSWEISIESPITNEEAAMRILMFDKALEAQKEKNFCNYLKIHFLILGRKFHPDENSPELKGKCEEIMQKINLAYFTVLGSLNSSFNEKVIKKDGNVYTNIDENNISGSFTNTFCVYSQPELVNLWVEVLGENLGVGACRLSSNRGVQFGSSEKACYVTVFDNGSIVSQGIMGLHYGVDVIANKLMKIVQTRGQAIECSKLRRSQKFKECLKMFTNGHSSDNMEHTTTPQLEQKCSECSGTIGDLKDQLQMALATISMLRKEVDLLKQSHVSNVSSSSEPSVMSKICERLEAIERDQKDMKATFGAQIAGAIRKAQMSGVNQPPPLPVPMMSKVHHVNEERGLPGQEDQSRADSVHKTRGWETENTANYKRGSQPSREFKPENTMVLFDFAKDPKSDREIRQLVNETSPGAVVQYINRTGERKPKYMIQFSSQQMKEDVRTKWNTKNLGGSKVRNPVKENKSSHVGFIKGVPTDIDDEELCEIVQSGYPGSKPKRIFKNNKPLETVKVFFESDTQLGEASLHGVDLKGYYFRAPVSRETPRVIYTQCFKCWRFGHTAKLCNSDEACKLCSNNHHYELCDSRDTKCSNCKQSHTADD